MHFLVPAISPSMTWLKSVHIRSPETILCLATFFIIALLLDSIFLFEANEANDSIFNIFGVIAYFVFSFLSKNGVVAVPTTI
jgi:hypothetical protein